jgi:membrane-bound serine protease (ClpP class)
MAPGTNLGAATPIQLGGVPGAPQPKDEKKSEPTAGERKAINDAVALLRSLAQLRRRDPDFADKAVREAATLTADEARKQGVVEIVAGTIEDLLAQADGRTVTVGGEQRTSRRGARRSRWWSPTGVPSCLPSSPIRTSPSSCC